MAGKRLAYSAHANDAIGERELDVARIVRTVRDPDWVIADPERPGVERRYRAFPEQGCRVLRVAVMKNPTKSA